MDGIPFLHSSHANRHRVTNGHPAGGFARDGAIPGIGSSRSRHPLSHFGIAWSSALVYGWVGCSKISSVVPSSMIKPPYITSIRFAREATTPRSWVIRMIFICSFSFNCLRSCRICAWIVTSSAVVGSSAINSRGWQHSAIAIMTRCLIPPENSWGY